MNVELISTALSKYGLKETPGAGDNPEILQMAKDAGFKDYIHDEIAWCSLFANWVAWKTGHERSHSLAARSWLTVGAAVAEPEEGDIVVLWREDPKSEKGHVGFWINGRVAIVYLLAGNQGDQVCIEGFDKSRVLGYRRLSKVA